VPPATRVTTLLLTIIVDAATAGRVADAEAEAEGETQDARALATPLAPIRSHLPAGVPAPLVQRALMVWTNLFGVISFELYGQLHQVVGEEPGDRDTFFAACIHRWIRFTGIA
jgi:hypothetical protein